MSGAEAPTRSNAKSYTWVGDKLMQETSYMTPGGGSSPVANGTASQSHGIQQFEVQGVFAHRVVTSHLRPGSHDQISPRPRGGAWSRRMVSQTPPRSHRSTWAKPSEKHSATGHVEVLSGKLDSRVRRGTGTLVHRCELPRIHAMPGCRRLGLAACVWSPMICRGQQESSTRQLK